MLGKKTLILLLISFLLGCSLSPVNEKPLNDNNNTGRWMQGFGPSRGHEDLTRFAVEKANELLETEYFPQVGYGDNGMTTDHPIVEGNYRTDFPDKRMKEFYGFSEEISSSDWANHPRLMAIHSLRNHNSDGTLQSAVESNEEWKIHIFNATEKGIKVYQNGSINEGLYWFGHSLHMIQDSFAPAHTIRSSKDGVKFKRLENLNSYGIKVDGVGYHQKIDLSGDRIWAINACWNPSCRDWECLKEEAAAACNVGAGYLYLIGQILSGNITECSSSLEKFFEGDDSFPFSGYLSSSNL